MTIRTLSVLLADLNLQGVAGCRIQVSLMRAGRESGTLVIPDFKAEKYSDENGEAAFDIWANDSSTRYRIKVFGTNGSKMAEGYFDMPDSDSNIGDLIVYEDETPLAGAEAQRVTAIAIAAKNDAMSAKTSAEQSADDANSANNGSQEAAALAGEHKESASQSAISAKSYRDESAIQAEISQSSASAALYARALAESARDSAFSNANVYPDTATGLAAVSNGQQFQVVSGEVTTRYQRVDATTAIPVLKMAAAAATIAARNNASLMANTVLQKQSVGTTSPATGSSLTNTNTFLIKQPASAKGYVESLRFFAATAGVLKLKRFTRNGNDYAFASETSFKFEAGDNSIVASEIGLMSFNEGDYFAVFCVSGSLCYTATALNNTPYYAVTGDVTASLTAGSLITANAIQLNLVLALNRDRSKGEIDGRLAVLEAEALTSQVIGTTSPVDGSSLSASPTYLLSTAILRTGYISSIDIYGRTAGTLLVKRFTKSGSDFTFVEQVICAFSAGSNTLSAFKDFANLKVNAGDYLGFFVLSGIVAFSVASNTTPYYSPAGDITTSFTASTLTTANRLAIKFTLASGLLPVTAARSEYRARLSLLENGSGVINNQLIGTLVPVDGANLSVAPTYLIDVPVDYSGFLKTVKIYGRTAGSIKFKRFIKSGGDYIFAKEVTCPFSVGLNAYEAWQVFDSLDLQVGDYLAFFVLSGAIAVTISTTNLTPYYSPSGDIVTSFTAGTRVTANRLEIGFFALGKMPDPASYAPAIVVPPFVYGVQGRECNVYLDNLVVDDAASYNMDAVASFGRQQDDRWTWTPSGSLGSGTITFSTYYKSSGTLISSGTAQLRAAAGSAGTGTTKTAIIVGDSLISAGVVTQTLVDIAAADVMALTLLGTRGSGSNKHEGRGGWKINDYTTVGRTYYSFTVSGVTDSPAINATEYSHNGAVFLVQEVNLSGGAGTITCSLSSGSAPLSSGTLTKNNAGLGDASITFSASAAVPGNPFWNAGTTAVDFANYLSTNSISAPDWVFISLGINDCFGQTSDVAVINLAATEFAKLDSLIASIKAASGTTKIGLCLPTPPTAQQYAFGVDYASGQTRWRFKRNIVLWARELMAKYVGQEANRIYIVPTNVALDTAHNMQTGNAAFNSRNTTSRSVQSNGVHPATSGYQQMGDAIWAFLKCNS